MSKFTPGPWIIDPYRPHPQEIWITAPQGDNDIFISKWEGLATVFGSDDDGLDGQLKAIANASLIAAAPELLESLEVLIGIVKEDHPTLDMSNYDKLVAKATGE